MPLEYPFIPMRLFRNFPYVTTVVVGVVGSMIYYSRNVLWPRQVAQLYETELLEIGWTSMTIGAGTLLGQVTGAIMCRPLGKQNWQLIAGNMAMTAFIGALAAGNESTRPLGVAFTLLGSFFVGYIELVVLTTAPMCLPPEDIGLATGVGGAFRAGAGTIATAIYVTILNNRLASNVPKYVTSAAVNAGFPSSSVPILLSDLPSGKYDDVPGITSAIAAAVKTAYRVAHSESFKIVYLVSIAFGVCAIAASILTPNLEGRFNDEVARKLHGKDIQQAETNGLKGVTAVKDSERSDAHEVEHV